MWLDRRMEKQWIEWFTGIIEVVKLRSWVSVIILVLLGRFGKNPSCYSQTKINNDLNDWRVIVDVSWVWLHVESGFLTCLFWGINLVKEHVGVVLPHSRRLFSQEFYIMIFLWHVIILYFLLNLYSSNVNEWIH